ncbi:MAG: tyrosine-type recombinase/integrase [Bdellovibrionaceae bacterium]|nr:tyrosine-type recombinase/integrase [Pseudobdellovibrionaceae bacterium]
MTKNDKPKLISLDYFAAQKANVQSPLQEIVKLLSREVNRHKLDYHQLKYIFKAVRTKCAVDVPRTKQSLLERPTDEELGHFFKSIKNPIHSLIFETLLNSGLRVAELCVLEIRRIDFEKSTIPVIDGKGGKDRTTVFGNKLKDKLLIYLQGKNNRYLFE